MGQLFYRMGIMLLQWAVRIHGLFNSKSRLFMEGRKNLFAQLGDALKENKRPLIWFHCASLGEFEQARPLLELFKSAYPEYYILLSFYSPSGYEVRKNYEKADHVCYMPLDTPDLAAKFVALTQPVMAFFVKYEFWYFHLRALADSGCWVYSVSTILRAKQIYFRWYGAFNRSVFQYFDHFFVQNKNTASLLKGIHYHSVTVSGDTRFDRVKSITENAAQINRFKEFTEGKKVLIGGSTWEQDVKAIAYFLQRNTEWKAIIAPHDISEANLKRHEELLGTTLIRWSQFTEDEGQKARVILVDNIGMLSSLYQYGQVAFIGGAFGAGLHNTLEAACFGLPVFFGNKQYRKFQEAVDLIQEGAAFSVADGKALSDLLESMDAEPASMRSASEAAHAYVQRNLGATEKIMDHLRPILSKIEETHAR